VFQAGPRVCLGQHMATFEAQLLLAFLVDRYEFQVPDKDVQRVFTYMPAITLTVKDGLELNVVKL
jgi:cytochrome P450